MLNLPIFGFVPSSLVDYPENTACVIFIKGCNMSCWYCHNRNVMIESEPFDENQVISMVNKIKRQKLLTGIVVTGGEPTIYGERLYDFLKQLKIETGKKIKLDTNGTNPEILQKILDDKIIDFVAMDIKTRFDKYDSLGFGSAAELFKSVDLIRKSGIDYQFRCTENKDIMPEDKEWIISNFPDIKWQKYVELEK
ncbi:MAG: anaerobic ribonucleoside-triphosphate reductase activating protein [Candidatus Wallbacteria bacterium]